MKQIRFQRALSTVLAMTMTFSLFTTPGVAAFASATQTRTTPDNMGPFPIETETVTYRDNGKNVSYKRSVRDPNIRPDAQLKLTSDNDYLVRSFQKSLDYTYDELVVGPRQFPMDDNDHRVTKHFAGEGPYTSTAVPSIWGTYHGFPGGGYRECFCDRDVSHTAEACSILALNEENYAMLERFAEESAELWWRETSHGQTNGDAYEPNAVWGNEKKDAMKWFPLWSQDFYGDAYYMDASFRELPAPFEVLDKVWTQYRWTGDPRWISDAMLNYGYRIHDAEDGLMDWYDYDGDGLVDNVRDYGWAPTLYEYEDASEMQNGQVTVVSKDEASGDASFPYKSVITMEPDFFQKHDFYQLPLDAKIIGVDDPSGNTGEQVFILNNLDKRVTDTNKPAILRNYDRLSSRRDDIRDVEIPLYTPAGVSFELYEGRHKLRLGTDYTVDTGKANYPVVTLKKEFFSNTGYPEGVVGADGYLEKKINLGIVTRFYNSDAHMDANEISRGTTELYLNTGDVVSEKDRMQLVGLSMKVGTETTDLTSTYQKDPKTGVINLDYHSDTPTSYTLTIKHRTPIAPRMTDGGGREKDLKDYFKVTSDLVRVLVAGDTIGCQYQALRGMADMVRARIAAGKPQLELYHYVKTEKVIDKTITLTEDLAKEYDERADAVQQQVWNTWLNNKWGYARAVNRLGELDTGWGHENSFFMPAKELLAPGEPTQKYLNFIQMNAQLGQALNEEALTYMPEAFYMSGQNVSGWQWSKVSMNRLDEQQRDVNQIMSTYPEIAMINIYNTINLLMGVEPQASTTAVSTLPRLTPEVGWVQAENIPLNQTGRDSLGTDMPDGKGGTYYGLDSAGRPRDIGFSKPKVGTLYTVRQDGTHTTTFTNQGLDGSGNGGDTIDWQAQFYSVDNQKDAVGYDKLYMTKNGVQTEITGDAVKHTTLPPYTTYTDLTVAPGETVIVSTRPDPAKPAANTKGQLYLSDFEWAFASYPQNGNSSSLITGAPKRDMSYAGTTLYEHDFMSSYAKGVGTKVSDGQGTTIRYLIPGQATAFTAKAILTDYPRTGDFEVDAGATTAVRSFEVFVDGVKQGDTVTVGGDLSAKDISVALPFNDTKLHTLDLVTSTAGGGDSEVGAAWADAKIAVAGVDALPGDLPETGMYLSNLSPDATTGRVSMDSAAEESKPMKMNGLVFQKGVGMSGKSSASFDLGGIYESLTFTLGKQDGKSMNGEMQIFLDDRQVYTVTATNCAAGPVTHVVELKNADNATYAKTLKLVYTGDQGCVNFADGILALVAGTDLTDPAIIAKRVLSATDAALGQAQYTMPQLPVKEPGKYTVTVATCEPAGVIAADGTITPGTDGQDVTVSFLITENDGGGRTGTTKCFAVYIPSANTIPLDQMEWQSASSNVRLNTDANGAKLKVDGEVYNTGVGMRNTDSVTYALAAPGVYGRFTGTVGYAQNSGNNGDDLFRVKFEGIKLDPTGKEIARDLLHFTPVLGKGDQGDNAHLGGCASCQQDILNYGYANSDQVDFDLDGYDKLTVTMVKVGDSSYGYCALVASEFHKTSPYEGKTVSALAPVAIDTVAKTKPALPAQVSATYAGMAGAEATRKLPVTWAAIDSGAYDTVGKRFDVEGMVRGTEHKAVCHVTVVSKIPLTAEKSSIRAQVYTAPTMPETVKVKYSDNSEGSLPVTWGNIPAGGYTRPGTVIVYGTIAGSALKPICAVEVFDPNAIKVAGMITLDNIVAGSGKQIGEFTLLGNGVSYPDSIFAHANSVVTIPLTGGDQEYTRFITDVGSKNGGAANFTSAGYGVKNGTETLLFKTDMVTSVRGENGSGDSMGYAYIDENTVYTVDVSVAGYDTLKLVADVANDPNSDHCVYGTPMLYTAASRVGQNLHTVTVTTGAGGAIWPNGTVAVKDGENLVLTIKPNPENAAKGAKDMGLDSLTLDGAAQSIAGLVKNPDGTYTYTLENITTDHAVNAAFRERALEELHPVLAAGNGTITIAAQAPALGAEFWFKHSTATDAANKPKLDEAFVSTGWTRLAEKTVVDVANGSTHYFQVVKVSEGQVKAWGEASATPDATLFQVDVVSGYLGDDQNATMRSAHTGDQIKVTANVPGGKRFTAWTATGLDLGENANKETFTFTMPAGNVVLTAQCGDITDILLATMDETHRAEFGWEKNVTKRFADGSEYPNSIWAHAPSEAVFDLGGGYTRFTTKVGTSGGSEATSFIAKAYGIDANGDETLLYQTDMVTKLGKEGSDNQGGDNKGYYYITDQGSAMRDVDVDVTGYQKLKLVMDQVLGNNADHAAYAMPMLYTAAAEQGKNFHTVTVTSTDNGAVWPNGKVAVDAGGTLTLTVKPNPDNTAHVSGAKRCYLASAKVDETNQTLKPNGDGTYTLTLTNVTGDHNVAVSFTAEKPVLTPVLTAGSGKLWLDPIAPETGADYYYNCGTAAGGELAIDSVFAPEGWTKFSAKTTLDALTNGTTYHVQVAKVIEADGAKYVKAWGTASAAPVAGSTVDVAVQMSGITMGSTYTGAPVIRTGDATGTYGEGQTYTGAFTYTYEGRNGTTYESSETAPTVAGDYTLKAEISGTAEYQGSGTLDFTIGRKAVSVTPSGASIYVGDALPQTYGLVFDGLVTGEHLDIELTALFSGQPGHSGQAGSYGITWTNAAEMKSAMEALPVGQNYTITCVDTCILTISDYPAPPPSNTETVKKENEDGSTTTTVTNQRTGTVTKTTKWSDGKVEIVETKKDGTVTTSVSTPDGTKTETVKNPDGSQTTSESRKDGTKVESTTSTEGGTSAIVTLPKDADKVIVTIPMPQKPKRGEVVVIVREDGSREIVKTAVFVEGGMRLALDETAKLEIMDNSKEFTDVAGSDWFSDAVQFVASREILTGTAKDVFTPGGETTRATIFTALARLDNQDLTTEGAWYEKAMTWAVERGISDGSAPEQSVTREQLAAMLYRYAGSPQVSGGTLESFGDAAAVNSWADAAMRWCVNSGILQGSAGHLNPGATATRSEVSVMLQRFVENLK